MTPTDDPVLLSDDSDGVRTLTLNRPYRKNAINPDLWIALRDALNLGRGSGRIHGVRHERRSRCDSRRGLDSGHRRRSGLQCIRPSRGCR